MNPDFLRSLIDPCDPNVEKAAHKHITNADPINCRRGPYTVRYLDWYFTYDDVLDGLAKRLTNYTREEIDNALPGAQRTFEVRDTQTGLLYALIPADEGDPDSDADFAKILADLNLHDELVAALRATLPTLEAKQLELHYVFEPLKLVQEALSKC